MNKSLNYMDGFIEEEVNDKNAPLPAFLHYSDPNANKVLTIFGNAEKVPANTVHNYDDRLCQWNYDKFYEGRTIAENSGCVINSARFFEIWLNHYHDTTDVNISCIRVGCNRSNGQSYLIFSYTYSK